MFTRYQSINQKLNWGEAFFILYIISREDFHLLYVSNLMFNVPGFVTMVKCLILSSTGQRQCLRLKRLMELMCVSLECMYKNMVLTVPSRTIGKPLKRETFKQHFEKNCLYITFGLLMYLYVSALSISLIFKKNSFCDFQASLHIISGQCPFLSTTPIKNCCVSWNSDWIFGICEAARIFMGSHLGLSTQWRGWLHISLPSSRAKDPKTKEIAGMVQENAR